MKTLFYNIAGAITEMITGCDGTGKGLEGIANVLNYINVLEDVKLILNICMAGVIALSMCLIGIAICNHNEHKALKELVALEEKA